MFAKHEVTAGKHGVRMVEVVQPTRLSPGAKGATMTLISMTPTTAGAATGFASMSAHTAAAPTGTAWERACSVDELEPSWGEALFLRMKQIALFFVSSQEIYAVSHRDPEAQAYVMARGIVGSKGERATVASPLNKRVYDLGTGECFSDSNLFLQTFRTRVVGGFVEVEVPV